MLWAKQDERRLRDLLTENETTLRERLQGTRARDLMAYYTWDALIANYMKGFEEEIKAAIIARKIADEFDPNHEANRHHLQQHISNVLWAAPKDPYLEELFEAGGNGEEIMRYISLKSPWPEGISTDVREPFEYECNELRHEVVTYLLGVAYKRRAL